MARRRKGDGQAGQEHGHEAPEAKKALRSVQGSAQTPIPGAHVF